MTCRRVKSLTAFMCAILTMVLVAIVAASSAESRLGGPPPTIEPWAISAGGGSSAANGYELRYTIGMKEAGELSSDGYVLIGGFLPSGAPTPNIPGDLNGDGFIGVADLLILLANWGPCPDPSDCPADFDGSGAVGVNDLLILLANWG